MCKKKKTEGVLPLPSLCRVNPRKNKMPITTIATAPMAKYKGNLFLEPPTSRLSGRGLFTFANEVRKELIIRLL